MDGFQRYLRSKIHKTGHRLDLQATENKPSRRTGFGGLKFWEA